MSVVCVGLSQTTGCKEIVERSVVVVLFMCLFVLMWLGFEALITGKLCLMSWSYFFSFTLFIVGDGSGRQVLTPGDLDYPPSYRVKSSATN